MITRGGREERKKIVEGENDKEERMVGRASKLCSCSGRGKEEVK